MNKTKVILSSFALWGIMLICFGFMVADHTPLFQSVGLIFLFLHPFVNNQWRTLPRALIRSPYAITSFAFYVLTLLTGFYINNLDYYGNDIVMKLAFIMIPIALVQGGVLSRRDIRTLLIFFVSLVFIVGTATFINYLIHFDEINEQITRSKPVLIVTGMNHIYYGVQLAFATILIIYAIIDNKIKGKLNNGIAITMAALMVLYLHSISARTGLGCFYGGLVVMVSLFIILRKKYLIGLGLLAGMGLFLLFSLKVIPSLKNRTSNTMEDIDHYKNKKGVSGFSIGPRLEALNTSWEIFKEHPFIGVGQADLDSFMQVQYRKDSSSLLRENRIKPHNQFVMTITALGVPGFLSITAYFILPFFRRRNWRNIVFMTFLTVIFAACQAESILQRQVGLTFFLLFYFILIVQLPSSSTNPDNPDI